VDHVPVHIGAVDLKKILYEAVIPKWNNWTNGYSLPLDALVMRSHNWVVLAPKNPDRNIIADYFFKPGKKGAIVFKAGKCVVNLHDLYQLMLTQKDEHELEENFGTTSRAAVDFTVSAATQWKIFYN
jgi:hypothetical protein